MLKNRKRKLYFALLALIVITGIFISTGRNEKSSKKNTRVITPTAGSIQSFISTTGVVEPQNRLEIKPPINGRIDEIKVSEGDKVKTGDVLASMSSTERAALLDAARAQGKQSLEYWQEVYKPTPLIAPIDGEIIVRAVEPGQTVTSSDAVVVLSDRLIVKANVDEVDIGGVKVGQKAIIGLDAYPEIEVNGTVDHISYESTLINNVTIYEVEILPDEIPKVFRSGMSANVDIVEKSKDNALIVPRQAVQQDEKGSFVYIKQDKSKEPLKRRVELGASSGERVEVVSGIGKDAKILITTQKYLSLPDDSSGGSPFMPDFKDDDKDKKKKEK
ncbi:MAG: efflux RND transporter periplasmic adaptor subunit [Candidatus Omnitrophica bacterium]|nr:efflux RND transporter periplasmic adaptor subunit [Candidatus Omnitrophota bacterium]MCF7887753.1 efflux RND transporter periplasmic adaptor subunit [Candidatus Omnitrophota bacterium]